MGEGGGGELKSAYERALERMQADGIEPPRNEAFGSDSLEGMAEARTRAKAKLAELEILHQKNLQSTLDPRERLKEDAEYQAERGRIEDRRDREIEKLRRAAEEDRG